MSELPNRFKALLTKALRRIAAETDQSILRLQNEIGESVHRNGAHIEWLRKGHVPPKLPELVELARVLVNRGGLLTREEFEQFLAYGGHPSPRVLRQEFPQLEEFESGRLYQRPKMMAKRQISLDGLVTSFTQIEIQSITKIPLSSVQHRRMFFGDSLEDWVLGFTPDQRDGSGSMRQRVLSLSTQLLVWNVEFDPPLLQNQRASYSYTQTCRGAHALTYEECHKRFMENYKVNDFEWWRLAMTAPTHQLHMSLEFPPHYPVAPPSSGWFNVLSGAADHHVEKARIIANNWFSARLDEITNQWKLDLIIQSASPELKYEFRWVPPREKAIQYQA